jgi:WD40 repeat protein/serine/threonine protein kinase
MTEREIFLVALELAAPEPRAAYLEGACGDNAALRSRVEELLREHFSNDDLLAGPAMARRCGDTLEIPSLRTSAQRIGRYKLLEKIGEGGMGEVWMAEQDKPVARRVAFKLIKMGMDTRSVIARFEAEGQALALMDHPNIARVLDAGATDLGRPYLVMELVRGVKITDYCDQHQLSTRDRLELFIKVCQAIQHAHQKGIIHRDLKPSNVLVTINDGEAVPKLIDFGIAKAIVQKLTDKTLFTEFQALLGTPAYMSPEQVDWSSVDIDTRSDIYSLGVLLYELLVGQPPFNAADMMREGLEAMRHVIREKDPVKPSTKLNSLSGVELTTTTRQRRTDPAKLTYLLKGDLDWIVMKCLEKDRARRYETANDLATDVRRYLSQEPVVARPPSSAYRLERFARRHRRALAATALFFVVVICSVAALILVQHRANRDYRQRLYISEVNRAGLAWQAGQSSQMLALLDRCPADLRQWEWKFLRQQDQRWKSTVCLLATNLEGATLSADGRFLLVAADHVIQLRDFPAGQWRLNIPFAVQWHSPFAVSPRGEYLATLAGPEGILTVWHLRTGERLAELNHGSSAQALAWSADGQFVATGGDNRTIRIWDPKTGREQRTLASPASILSLAFAPNGRTLAVGAEGAGVQLLDLATGSVKRNLRTRGRGPSRLTFSPDGQKLATSNLSFGGYGADNRVWSIDAEEGSLDVSSSGDALWFAFSPDSQRLVLADHQGTIRLWDLDRRAEIERISAHIGNVNGLLWLSDGRIFSAGADGAVRIWESQRSGLEQLKGYRSSLRTLAFSGDSRFLAAAGIGRDVFLWNVAGSFLAGTYTNHTHNAAAVAFGPDGRVATAGGDQSVQVWNPATLETTWASSIAPASVAYWVAFSPDGRRIYAASNRDTLTILDSATGKHLGSITGLGEIVDGLAVSPDGRLLAICQKVKLSVWLADGSRELWQVPANPDRCAAFSPDGKWIATGDQDGEVSLWEVASAGRVHRTLRSHSASVSGVSFHPDGSRLVSSSKDGTVKVWDWRAGVELLTLPAPGGGILWHAVFSPDGRTVAAAGGDGVVTLWKTE